ncbi:MAG: RHS repeat protein, partial [Kiritimatiellae bacterium]|nr:RHS repeat protein [Kiritimatiellia bacterium]
MPPLLWTALSLSLAGVMAVACAAIFLRGRGARMLRGAMAAFAGLRRTDRILVAVIFAALWIYAGNKPDGGNGERGMGNGPSAQQPFTAEDFERGFVLVRSGTNENFSFDAPSNAVPCADWLAFGAAEDWVYLGGEPMLRVFSNGRVQLCVTNETGAIATNLWLAPLSAPLGIVPEANWVEGNGEQGTGNGELPSLFWHSLTPSNTLQLTWRNALLNRDTNTPVSVQAELSPNGRFAYRYDLASVKWKIESGEWNAADLTNVVIGAALGGAPFLTTLATIATNASFSIFHSPFNISFHPLSAEDAANPDRDGDGLSLADELFTYATDPDLPDTSGDGISDGEAVALGLDPLERNVPDADILASVAASTNNEAFFAENLASWRLFNGFAAELPEGATNLVWERTFDIGRSSAWQQFFISANPTNAAGWFLQNLLLEWETDTGACGAASVSPIGDSLRIPLATNDLAATLTLRLRATGEGVMRSPRPLHLIAYSPTARVEGGREIIGQSGARFFLFTGGVGTSLRLVIDHSGRPCNAPVGSDECDMSGFEGMADDTGGDFTFSGDATGGLIYVSRPGIYTLPNLSPGIPPPALRRQSAGQRLAATANGGGSTLVVLDPSVGWNCGGHGGRHDGLSYDWYGDSYSEDDPYPLDTACLRRKWYRDWDGGWSQDSCTPWVSSGLGNDGDIVTTDFVGDTGRVLVDGVVAWFGSAEHTYGEAEYGGDGDDPLDDECGCESDCADGNCDSLEGPSLGSLKFRIPLGAPVKGQVAGFVWFSSDDPLLITKGTFQLLAHPDATVADTTASGIRRIVCSDRRGRDLRIGNIANGVRVTIYDTAANTLEHTWEIVNENGSASQIRLRKISRLDNVMSDETFTYYSGDWIRFDNVAGVATSLSVNDNFAGHGEGLSEMRTTTDASGTVLSSVYVEKNRVGYCDNAVLRETIRVESTGRGEKWSQADYWDDPSHSDRHGRPRLVWGNARPWVYTDYDELGHETLRVEQRGDSAWPLEFPHVVSNELFGVSDIENAFVTVWDYAPPDGDSCHPDDAARPRCETRYVVSNGEATLIGRTWTRYTRLFRDGYAAIRREALRMTENSPSQSFNLSTFQPFNFSTSQPFNFSTFQPFNFSTSQPFNFSTGIAYSYEITYADTGDGTPLLMRNAAAETLDEDGILTVNGYTLANGRLICESHRFGPETGDGRQEFKTYEVTESDPGYGTVLRRTIRLTADDTIVADEQSIYDNQNRLRSTSYLDGTSLTNAYSCCRLLWSRDREGRKVLRSAQTGTDHLYYAEEEVWLREIENVECRMENGGADATNGFKVTQHFFDALGRETNTVVGIAHTPGEASTPASILHSTFSILHSHIGSDYSVSTDERGATTVVATDILQDCVETTETVLTNGVEVMETKTRSFYGGGSSTCRAWGPILNSQFSFFNSSRRFTEYDALGRRVEYAVTESSDGPVVTNSVSTYDLLGRLVSTAAPGANGATILTVHAYDGATSRLLSSTTAADCLAPRTADYLYDDLGEQVGRIVDGITNRADVAYENLSNEWWKVEATAVVGPGTNSMTVVRTQLTGLSDACRRHVVTLAGRCGAEPQTVAETIVTFDPETGIETETTTSPTAPTTIRRSLHGVLLSTENDGEKTTSGHDALGRVVATSRQMGADAPVVPVQSFNYASCGDLIASTTYTNGTDAVTETYDYDMLGNRVATTDALGGTIYKAYDPFGRVVAEWGATYPVRHAYDTHGRRTSLSTTRDGTTWDTTTWAYDPFTGYCVSKTYAEGSTVTYTYTHDNLPLRTTYASGRWKENTYDANRRLVSVEYGNATNDILHSPFSILHSYAYDVFGQRIAESNAVASTTYQRDVHGNCTNETTILGGPPSPAAATTDTIERAYDSYGRLVQDSLCGFAPPRDISYSSDGLIAAISNDEAVVEYSYTSDRLDAGYTLTLTNGTTFTRTIVRDAYRRNLVIAITNSVNGVVIETLEYAYDAL